MPVEVLLENFGDSSDPLIQVAVDLVLRQPRRGFLGATERHWDSVYWPRVQQLLTELDKGEGGVAPASRLYPIVTRLRLLGLSLVALSLLAAGAERGFRIWKHVTRTKPLGDWDLFLDLIMAMILAACSLALFRGVVYRFHLYRHKAQQEL